MISSSGEHVLFIGGGHMAAALIGGVLAAGHDRHALHIVEPLPERRAWLQQRFGVRADAALDGTGGARSAGTVVWAVKPQRFDEAARDCGALLAGALHLSVMAGIRTDALVRATGSGAVVRAMPNTPALIGQGIAGLFARPEVSAVQRRRVEALLGPTGELLWVDGEADLDAVTALSGSGPAYVFYLAEAMIDAGTAMGLSPSQSRTLALATLAGATALARQSADAPAALRAQVTSPGGTTEAAIASLEADGVKAAIVRALRAAQGRAAALGG